MLTRCRSGLSRPAAPSETRHRTAKHLVDIMQPEGNGVEFQADWFSDWANSTAWLITSP